MDRSCLRARSTCRGARTRERGFSGFNGRILFTSGRGAAVNNDSEAKLYLRTIDSSVGGGSTGATITPTAGVQHRHGTWSPDRTMIAYARGDASCATQCDIYTLDLTDPAAVPQNITNTATVTEDRPAWSPDGTRIAYESEVADGSGQSDILVKTVGSAVTPLNLTNTTTAGQFENKPAWSPDSSLLYYSSGNTNAPNASNILREPSNGGSVDNILTGATIGEFQPAVSPDGKQLCYTRGEQFNGTADVYVTTATVNAPVGINLSDNLGSAAANGDYNCTWSPDGLFVAYVQGTFTSGDLVMERADDSEGPLPLETRPCTSTATPTGRPTAPRPARPRRRTWAPTRSFRSH